MILSLPCFFFLSACSDEESDKQPTVTKVSLPKNPTQDYDYLLNDVQIKDNYMWLEQKTPQRTAWIEQQADLTNRYFSALDSGVETLKSSERRFNRNYPRQFIDRFFYIKQDPVTEESQIAVFDTIKEIETELGQLPQGHEAVSSSLSAKGRFFAVQTQNKNDQYRWLLFDLATRQFHRFRFPTTSSQTEFNWLAGFNRFIYQTDHEVYYQNLGQGPDFNHKLFDLKEHVESTEPWALSVKLTDDSRFIVISAKHLTDASDMVWVLPINSSGQTEKLVNLAKNTRASLNFVGNINETFYFHTNLVAPRWRIISINLNQPSRRDWKEVISQQNELLISAQLIGNRWLLQYLNNTQQKLYLSQLNGNSKRSIEVPANSTIEIQSITQMLNGNLSALLTINSFHHPSTIFTLNLNNLNISAAPIALQELDDIVSETVFYRSVDGSRIPLTLFHDDSLKKDSDNPTLLITNKGFGHIQTPYFLPLFDDWLKRGGIVAIAHIRGGGVYGESWRQSVSGQKHARAVEDIISAVDWLADNNYSSRKKIAAYGDGFAANLIMEASIHAPQNFKALALKNLEANYLTYLERKDPLWMKEFALNSDQASTEWFLAVSPYHRLSHKNYPAVLIIDDESDPSVSNYKTLAKWQNLQLSKRPVLLFNKDSIEELKLTEPFALITQEAIKQFLSNELRADHNGPENGHQSGAVVKDEN